MASFSVLNNIASVNAQANVAWCHYASRRFEEGIAEFRRALHIDQEPRELELGRVLRLSKPSPITRCRTAVTIHQSRSNSHASSVTIYQ